MSNDTQFDVEESHVKLAEEDVDGETRDDDELYLCAPKPKPKLFSYNWAQGTLFHIYLHSNRARLTFLY